MDLSKVYSPRQNYLHKGAYGSVLVVAGSKFYSGSATLAAGGALRAGVDLVTVVAPARAADVAAHKFTDLITYPLKGEYLTRNHIKDILDVMAVRKVNSLVLGCGMGRHTKTITAINMLISKLSLPMVLDADALYAISKKPEVVLGKQVVLTPHLGEAAILLGHEKIKDDFETRLAAAKEISNKYQAVVVLKGHVDVISAPSMTITNNSGTAYMTKGGFGDILAGIVGALLARGAGVIEAAHVGAYICGKSGELASKYYGEGLLASDIFTFIPQAIHN